MGFGYDQKKIAIPLDHPGDSLFNVGILENIYDLLFISYRIFLFHGTSGLGLYTRVYLLDTLLSFAIICVD